MHQETIIGLYSNDIKRNKTTKPLSQEEEKYLGERIKQGDVEARNDLVTANLRFVIRVANTYAGCGVPVSDLIGAGNIGLITAAERFDGTRGFKFISYAVWWIRQAILQCIGEHSRTVRIPMNRVALLVKIKRASETLLAEFEQEPDENALAADLDISIEKVLDTIKSGQKRWSLNRHIGSEDGHDYLDLGIIDDNTPAPDAPVYEHEQTKLINEILDTLDDRERDIVIRYFGLCDTDEQTLEQLGEVHKVNRERVRQIKNTALQRLRHPVRSRKLIVYAKDM